MSNEKFDAKKYANDFEELSLEIIEIIFFKGKTNSIIDKKHTQQTRDQGVDGYIKFMINGTDYIYTVEAKLRTTKTLGLRDFASSILYSLINFSTKHFVVTNIIYSDEAVRVIEELNMQDKGNIDLIDGRKLQNIINNQLDLFNKYPKSLVEYIRKNTLPKTTKKEYVNSKKDLKIDNYLISSNIRNAQKIFLSSYKEGILVYLVEGQKGTGKTSFINYALRLISQSTFVEHHEVDMSDIKTPYLFCMEIIQIVTGIDLLNLFGYLSETDKEELTTDTLFLDGKEEIGIAIKLLLNEKIIDSKEHQYYIKKLLPKIIGSRDSYPLALHFSHLEKANKAQIGLLFEMLSCFTQNNIIVFIEFLIPTYQKETPLIKMEDWYNIRDNFTSYKDQSTYSSVITMKEYSIIEKTELLKLALHRNCSTQYYEYVSDVLGCNPEIFHLGLNTIKREKLYTISLIEANKEQLRNIDIFYHNMYNSYIKESSNISLINYAIAVAELLEGSVPQKILTLCLSQYPSAETILVKSLFFVKEHFEIRIVSEQIFDIPASYGFNASNDAQQDILAHVKEIFRQEPDQQYYICLLHILHGEIDKDEIVKLIKELKYRKDIKRVENILYSLYRTMSIQKYDEVSMLDVVTEYLNYTNKQYLYYTTKSKEMFLVAEQLYQSIIFSEIDRAHCVGVLLKYYDLKYYRSKMCYDNEKCKQYVDNILEYEYSFPQYESYFISAHKNKALIYKEQGLYREEFREYICAIRKYPQSKELKLAFGMNASAYYYYRNPPKAMKIMTDLIQYASLNGDDFKKQLWLYHDFEMLKMFNGFFDLNELLKMRDFADRISASNILARSYNIEGYYYFNQGNVLKAMENFEVAVNICKMAGKNKPYFLFLANLITTKIILSKDVKDDFDDAILWINNHSKTIYQRLKRAKKIETEHLFAALVSYLISSLSVPQIHDNVQKLIKDKCYDIPCIEKSELINRVHRLYCLKNNIIILF